MRNHLLLGTIAGIPIGLHSMTTWLVAGLCFVSLISSGGAAALGMFLMLLILGVVVLAHELGHALVAKRLGIHVQSITLYPFGGMAHMAMIPERGREELVIALAGPATNLLLALPVLLLVPFQSVMDPALISTGTTTGLLWYWLIINLLLGLFNMLPAFPLDGGRVLRALLVPSKGFLPATEIAVKVGRWIAAAMMLWAIFGSSGGQGWGLALVAIFIWLMGGRELFTARLRHATGGAGNPLEMFAEMFKNGQAFGGGFSGEGQGGFPGGFHAPEDEPAEAEFEERESRRGFSDEDIKRLEGFHGRLPKRPKEEG